MLALPIPRARGSYTGGRWRVGSGLDADVEPRVARILQSFDGQKDLVAVASSLRPAVSAKELREVVQRAALSGLLEEPDWQRLPIEVLGESRFRCLGCGTSCRFDIGPLLPSDLERLAALDLRRVGHQGDYLREMEVAGVSRSFLKKHEDACVFYDHDARNCKLHATFGAQSKPLACQAFPVQLAFGPGGLRLSLRSSCAQRIETFQRGTLLKQQESWVRQLQTLGWGKQGPFPVWVLFLPEQATAELAPGAHIPFSTYVQLEGALLEALSDPKLPMAGALCQGLRFLYGVLTGQPALGAQAPTVRERARGRECLRNVCALLAAEVFEPEQAALLRRIGQDGDASATELDAQADGFLRELLKQEIWGYEPLRWTGSFLPGCVMLVIACIAALALARGAAERRGAAVPNAAEIHAAYNGINRIVLRVQPDRPETLLPFAQGPVFPS